MMKRNHFVVLDGKEGVLPRIHTRLWAGLLAALLLIPLWPARARAASYHTDIRVHLSIGRHTSFSFTPVGDYYLQEAPELAIEDGKELSVEAVGGRASVRVGDETVSAPSLTFVNRDYAGKSAYIRLEHDNYGTCTYLGNMRFDVTGNYIRAINTLPLEHYLYGVVPHEMSNTFPVEALKAQAVCARGYAMSKCSRNAAQSYDIRDTSQDQVYRGYASKNHRAVAAVDETRGQVLVYDGDIVESYYSASNGGQTERTGNVWENDLPYYVNADDEYDLLNASSLEDLSFIPAVYNEETLALMDMQVRAAIERAACEAAGEVVRLVSTVSVMPCEAQYDAPSRSYTKVDLALVVERADGTQGQVSIRLPLDELDFGSYDNQLGSLRASKTRLRLRGAEACVLRDYKGAEHRGWYLTARRYGHGVGLSQRSAQERARAGQSYEEILAFYFVGTELITIGDYTAAPALTSERYRVESWGVSGISPGTEAESFLSRLESEAELSLVNYRGRAKTEGDAGTGNFVRMRYTSDGQGMTFDLPLVVYGDLDGDGSIAQEDVEALQKHLLRTAVLGGPYLRAADANHDGAVDILDLHRLIRAAQGDADIEQEA